MEIIPAGPGRPEFNEIMQDYRRQHSLPEGLLLNLFIEALSSGRSAALLALEGGRTLGLVVLSRLGPLGRIHLLHAVTGDPQVEAALLERAEEWLGRETGLEHIEASLAVRPGGGLEQVFCRRGYRVVSRARLVLDLRAELPPMPPAAPYTLRPWQGELEPQVLSLIEACHSSRQDLLLYPELAGPGGPRHLLERAVRGDLGRFEPALSAVALDGPRLAGFCLAVWHAALPGQGFIVDLCVDPTHRRRGLARALTLRAAHAFRQAGAQALGLAVTLDNHPARRLYQELGFQVEQYFSLFRK